MGVEVPYPRPDRPVKVRSRSEVIFYVDKVSILMEFSRG